MYFDKVYKCDLLSITPDIEVYDNVDKKINIFYADLKPVKKIIVRRTLNPYVYQEVLTGKLIPTLSLREGLDFRLTKSCAFIQCLYKNSRLSSPVCMSEDFIAYRNKLNNVGRILADRFYANDVKRFFKNATPFTEASASELKKYIQENIDDFGSYNTFLNELNEIFVEAERYYNGYYKNYIDEDNQESVKGLLKQLKKNK